MAEPRAQITPDGPDATLVTPRFDEEETVLAQPVVPLDAEAVPPAAGATAAAAYAPRARALRRQWPLTLALVSALVGSVIGGLGLYLFQQRERSAAEAPAESAQPAPAPADEQAAEVKSPVETAPVETAPAAEPEAAEEPLEDEAPSPADARAAGSRGNDDDEDDDDARGDARVSAPPVRDAGARDSAPVKRGKKGERDGELQRRERRAPPDYSPPIAHEGGGREARRVDSIVYPTRRAERRAERRARRAARNVDRVRAIFEGQPE